MDSVTRQAWQVRVFQTYLDRVPGSGICDFFRAWMDRLHPSGQNIPNVIHVAEMHHQAFMDKKRSEWGKLREGTNYIISRKAGVKWWELGSC